MAGHDGLDRELRWAHVIEMPDPDDLLKGGELVLTTGLGAGAKADAPARVDRLGARAGRRGGRGRARDDAGASGPGAGGAACAAADVPLVAFRRAVRFIEITEAVHAAVLNASSSCCAAARRSTGASPT